MGDLATLFVLASHEERTWLGGIYCVSARESDWKPTFLPTNQRHSYLLADGAGIDIALCQNYHAQRPHWAVNHADALPCLLKIHIVLFIF